jgi:hypothetical protein
MARGEVRLAGQTERPTAEGQRERQLLFVLPPDPRNLHPLPLLNPTELDPETRPGDRFDPVSSGPGDVPRRRPYGGLQGDREEERFERAKVGTWEYGRDGEELVDLRKGPMNVMTRYTVSISPGSHRRKEHPG